MAGALKVKYTIVFNGVGKQWEIPLVGDIMTTFNQVPVHRTNGEVAGTTNLSFELTGDARAAIIEMCYRHLSPIAFDVTITETIASHSV